ncbi:MAG: tRNA (adenosine(37)-N6)-threonylcarbamoyltransferase complex ATPase subunit type 1 TsaE, partial [Thermoleophilia bacterium]|nr:tRNA (adenosine(37)-N6)-threonylcarbamoyltransferase complex ATPase subunit type 1 TsaE [Thermoleophilia bacterium]
QTRRFARALAALLAPPALITVEGDLGTGKTTLIREVLRARGVRGAIASPSFTIAQSYRGRGGERLHHLDLYRLSAGAETELFAWDDYLGGDALTFVEWPEAGREALPPADVRLVLEHRTRARRDARLWASPAFEERLAAASAEAGVAVERSAGEHSVAAGGVASAAPTRPSTGRGATGCGASERGAADGAAGRDAP